MSSKKLRSGGIAAAWATACLLAPMPAVAQSDRVAVHQDWSVFTPSDPRECYIVSPPTASVARRDGEVTQVSRGDIRLFVTYRPDDGVEAEVSFTSGYPFRDGSTVELAVGGSTFSLGPGPGEANEWAWPASPAEDARVVDAFRRGAEATVTGVSSRGTTTTDTFSLMGFTAALEEAQRRCQ